MQNNKNPMMTEGTFFTLLFYGLIALLMIISVFGGSNGSDKDDTNSNPRPPAGCI